MTNGSCLVAVLPRVTGPFRLTRNRATRRGIVAGLVEASLDFLLPSLRALPIRAGPGADSDGERFGGVDGSVVVTHVTSFLAPCRYILTASGTVAIGTTLASPRGIL